MRDPSRDRNARLATSCRTQGLQGWVKPHGYNASQYTARSGCVKALCRSFPTKMTSRQPHLSLTRSLLALARTALLAGLGIWASQAWANDYAEVQRLLNAGQATEALALADRYISSNPRDPQMRFIKSQVLQRSGQASEAEAILTQLTQDYPELAEPWNNLAVIFAGKGELDKAREALEIAIRQNPRYATALENLGDVQVRLAARSYERARSQGGDTPRLTPKIDALRSLSGN